MTTSKIAMLKRVLESLQHSNENMTYPFMEEAIVQIKTAIAKEDCTWEELGITEDEFSILELNCFNVQLSTVVANNTKARNNVQKLAHSFRAGVYNDDPTIAQEVANTITKAVGMGLFLWDELGLTPEILADTLTKISQ